MKDIAEEIQKGAMAFLATEYKVLAMFVVVVAALLGGANVMFAGEGRSPLIAVSFVVGAGASAPGRLLRHAGWRPTPTSAPQRRLVRASAQHWTSRSAGGAVMGMSVVGLAAIGLGGLFILYTTVLFPGKLATSLNVLTGFSMGASSIALFARVGGGIYTKVR